MQLIVKLTTCNVSTIGVRLYKKRYLNKFKQSGSVENGADSTCSSFQESPPVRSHGIGRSQWPHYYVSGAKRIVFGTLPFLFNTWTSTMIGWCVWQRICFNSSLAIPFLLIYYKNDVFKNKEGTAPVTDQNSESKYMNTAVCIFLHWGIGKCLQDGFSQPTSQTTAPTVFSFRLAKKPARLVPTLHRVSWNFNQISQHFNKHFKRLALEAFYRRLLGRVLGVH